MRHTWKILALFILLSPFESDLSLLKRLTECDSCRAIVIGLTNDDFIFISLFDFRSINHEPLLCSVGTNKENACRTPSLLLQSSCLIATDTNLIDSVCI